ncbi:MAG: hypothetical protein HY774_01090 [Acidobacteria bacterium]|nr:hypothetical protein [Acidobacteriota bacterium]
MQSAILPSEIQNVGPLNLSDYLKKTGWKQERELPERVSFWVNHDQGATQRRILLPLQEHFFDFEMCIEKALKTLEAFEHRPQSEILQDIVSPGIDVIRIRLDQPVNWRNGIPLQQSLALTQTIEKMLKIAALQVVDSQMETSSSGSVLANEFLDRIQIQIHHNEKLEIELVSPLPKPDSSIPQAVPFERKVVDVLAAQLTTLQAGITPFPPPELFQTLNEMRKVGVTRNLCETITGLGNFSRDEVEFGISRSRKLPAESYVKKTIHFSSDDLQKIKELNSWFDLFERTACPNSFQAGMPNEFGVTH